AAFLAGLFTMLLDGHNAAPADGVKRALGRDAKDFTAFAREAAGQGRWRG
ncbi:NmrA family transcriptional regulator, partial [Streptomyces sp. SID3915]|nr:NmrA family transcriptional regulator [Streptomyces sp. SID3915]